MTAAGDHAGCCTSTASNSTNHPASAQHGDGLLRPNDNQPRSCPLFVMALGLKSKRAPKSKVHAACHLLGGLSGSWHLVPLPPGSTGQGRQGVGAGLQIGLGEPVGPTDNSIRCRDSKRCPSDREAECCHTQAWGHRHEPGSCGPLPLGR